jgi:TRAP-type mannitol/chloroaromatic compound transport system permease small subunit
MAFFVAVYMTPTALALTIIALVVAIAALWTIFFDPRMGGLIGLSRAIDALNSFIGRWVSWLILISVLVSAVNATIRKIFNESSNAWLELQWYLFGAAFLLAAAYTLQQNEHIRIDILYNNYSRRKQHWVDLLGHIFFLMPFVILMICYFVPYVLLSYRSGEVSTNAGGLIIWPGKLMLLIGFFLLGLQGVSEIIKKIAIMRGLIPDTQTHVPSHQSIDEVEDLDPTEIR